MGCSFGWENYPCSNRTVFLFSSDFLATWAFIQSSMWCSTSVRWYPWIRTHGWRWIPGWLNWRWREEVGTCPWVSTRKTLTLILGQWRGALMFSLVCAWTNGLVNNHDAGDLRRHRSNYDVSVMTVELQDWLHRHNHCAVSVGFAPR